MNLLTITNYEECNRRIQELEAFKKSLIIEYYSEEFLEEWLLKHCAMEEVENDHWSIVFTLYGANLAASLKDRYGTILTVFATEEEEEKFYLDDDEFFTDEFVEYIHFDVSADEMIGYYPSPQPKGMHFGKAFEIDHEFFDNDIGLDYQFSEEGYEIYMKIYRLMCKHKDKVLKMFKLMLDEREDSEWT